MPSKRGLEQAILWLHNKSKEKDSLDGINAEICLNVIKDLQNQNTRKGALIHKLKDELSQKYQNKYYEGSDGFEHNKY